MPERLYTFEVWGQQLLDFIDEVVGEPTFLVSNSVGGVLLDPQKFRAALFHVPCQTSLLRRQVPHMPQTALLVPQAPTASRDDGDDACARDGVACLTGLEISSNGMRITKQVTKRIAQAWRCWRLPLRGQSAFQPSSSPTSACACCTPPSSPGKHLQQLQNSVRESLECCSAYFATGGVC